jgi:WhiB family transcriptional regulator, redox-sensing transcriptional regulator
MSDPTGWMDSAACAGTFPDAFFPRDGDKGYELKREALAVCAGCPVATQCLAYALDNALDYGIFGGLTSQERRVIGRKRKTPTTIARPRSCGTESGVKAHQRRGEPACRACLDAASLARRIRAERAERAA